MGKSLTRVTLLMATIAMSSCVSTKYGDFGGEMVEITTTPENVFVAGDTGTICKTPCIIRRDAMPKSLIFKTIDKRTLIIADTSKLTPPGGVFAVKYNANVEVTPARISVEFNTSSLIIDPRTQ